MLVVVQASVLLYISVSVICCFVAVIASISLSFPSVLFDL